MITPEELAELRRRVEHPQQPLDGALAVYNSDGYCDWCRGQGKDEGDCYLPAAEGWVVVGYEGGTYHVSCAQGLGWTPTENEAVALAKYPHGPYA